MLVNFSRKLVFVLKEPHITIINYCCTINIVINLVYVLILVKRHSYV